MARTSRSIAVADCETDPFLLWRIPQPFLWGFFDGVSYAQYEVTGEFVDSIRKKPIILYAHNGGKFDWHFLLPFLQPYDDVMLINGRIAKCYIGMCELRDSYNILPVPLSAYKKDDIDYQIMERDQRHKPENWSKICDYLRSDCVYLHELVTAFIDNYGIQLTQATAAMTQWKKISTEPVPHTDKEFYDIISPYYYGGRVQCFEAGIINTEFGVYDINSAYPFAMMQKHPYSTSFSIVNDFVDGADFYKLEADATGAFPYRGEGDPDGAAGLRFPADGKRREFCITRWEYEAARDTKMLGNAKVLESVVFDGHVDFGEYIQYFYQKRLEAKASNNAAESLFAKLLMNSLYGKFAANPEHYRDYIIVPMEVVPGLESEGYEFSGELGPWALASKALDELKARYYNVATGASITGFVRAMLWRAIADSDGVLYCDTDSVAVRRKGESIKLGDALGLWKHEGNFDRAGIAGKKLYIFRGVPDAKGKREHKTASKGCRLSDSELWQVARGQSVTFVSDAPTFSAIKAPHFVKRVIKYTAEVRT